MNCRYRECQPLFDDWRNEYNTIRSNEVLDTATPASKYLFCNRIFPEKIPEPEYDETDIVRSLRDQERVKHKGQEYMIGRACKGSKEAIRLIKKRKCGGGLLL